MSPSAGGRGHPGQQVPSPARAQTAAHRGAAAASCFPHGGRGVPVGSLGASSPAVARPTGQPWSLPLQEQVPTQGPRSPRAGCGTALPGSWAGPPPGASPQGPRPLLEPQGPSASCLQTVVPSPHMSTSAGSIPIREPGMQGRHSSQAQRGRGCGGWAQARTSQRNRDHGESFSPPPTTSRQNTERAPAWYLWFPSSQAQAPGAPAQGAGSQQAQGNWGLGVWSSPRE